MTQTQTQATKDKKQEYNNHVVIVMYFYYINKEYRTYA